MLALVLNIWHLIEFAIAVAAGITAGSIALIGFGADSFVERLAGTVIVWLFTGGRGSSHAAERRAQQLIAISFFVLAAYVAVESIRDLVQQHHAEASWVGIGLAAVTAPTMPLLARAKQRVGRQLELVRDGQGGSQSRSARTCPWRCWSACSRTPSPGGGGPILSLRS